MLPVIPSFVLLQGDVKTARKEIQARYDALERGFRKMDPAVLDGLMLQTSQGPRRTAIRSTAN